MIDLEQFQQEMDKMNERLKEFDNADHKFVTVGIHEEAGMSSEGSITQAGLGATHHFGATINHPGGVPYGYKSENDAKAGVVRFLKKGTGFMVLGKTEPHQIKIPARPWLDVGVVAGVDKYVEAVEDVESIEEALEIIGIEASASVKDYIRDLRTPPNAKSTIAKKKSSNPLIDTGEMLQSVDYTVTSERPEEGL